MEPGTFFEMQKKVESAIALYESLVNSTPFESVKDDLKVIREECNNALYRVAVAGLSRVGKSSMINLLLKRPYISPTDVWQTTGVPILINSGKHENITIHFNDSSKPPQTFIYAPDVIKQYPSRDFNEDNVKGIKTVNVCIASPQLERGVMLYDIPGLDDPNDQIMDFAYHTAECANAILYVIDGSSARSGSFVFKNDFKKHIERFSKSKDKLFLVINKVDQLPPERLNGLKSEIDRNLDKYGLRDKVNSKIYYLALDPERGGDLQKISNGINTFDELERDVWSFLLTESKVGFFQLYSTIKKMSDSEKRLHTVVRSRSIEAGKKKHLLDTMNDILQKIPNLGEYIHAQEHKIKKALSLNVDMRKKRILQNLEKSLFELETLPSDEAIKSYLSKHGQFAVKAISSDLCTDIATLVGYVDKWNEENLKRVRDIINITPDQPNSGMDAINNIDLPTMDFSNTWMKALLAAFMAAIGFTPIVGFVVGVGSMILDFLIGKEERKAKRIRKMVGKISEFYDEAFADAQMNFHSTLHLKVEELIERTNSKLTLHFKDVDAQLNAYSLDPQFDYSGFETNYENNISGIRTNVEIVWEEIQKYMAIIQH